jgi:nucleotide-binding universal stress UspA family protein
MFQRILVPLDGSARAEHALPIAAQIACATGGSLFLVQVIPSPPGESGSLAPASQRIATENAEAREYLTSLAASPMFCGITTKTDIVSGPPASSLRAVAQARESDLVVLSRHGSSGLTHWALGSVAHALLHHSRIPLLLVPDEPGAGDLLKMRYPLRALVPLDGSPLSEEALLPAAHLLAALSTSAQGTLHLAQVIQANLQESITDEYETTLQQSRQYLRSVAEGLQPTLSDLHLALTSSIETDADVASALLHLAELGEVTGCDLIALSTHGQSGWERRGIGSVAERVLSSTRLPMLLIWPPKQAERESKEKGTM